MLNSAARVLALLRRRCAAWALASPCDEHADPKDRVAFHGEKFEGLQFRRD